MSRFQRPPIVPDGVVLPREKQLSLLERLDELASRAEVVDPTRPARAIFWIVLALMGLGLLLQASHASTTTPSDEYWAGLVNQTAFRIVAVFALIGGMRLGPDGLRRFVPALTLACALFLVLVYVPGLGASKNGSHRWLTVPGIGFSFQPSELARVVMILWVADRCLRLGDDVRDMRRGVLPMLKWGLFVFALILFETDLGGALLFLMCFLCTMWVGGARPSHVAGPLFGVGGAVFIIVITTVSYVRHRIEMWLGATTNDQVQRTTEAITSGGWFGNGLGQGLYRNARVPYLDSDYVFALVGEELGLAGMWITIALFVALLWFSMRFVLSIRDRYSALCSFGLLLSVGLQSMVHLQVVTRLAPPKGMTLPFLSHGGTSLIVSSLAVGLALGAARREARANESSALASPEPTPEPLRALLRT